MRYNNQTTYEEVTSRYDYNPDTGALTDKYDRQVGSVQSYGYRRIRINGKWYPVHRLAWLITHKVWPSGVIDHINGNRDDNRLVNLRDISTSENNRNSIKVRPTYSKKYVKKNNRKSTISFSLNTIEPWTPIRFLDNAP